MQLRRPPWRRFLVSWAVWTFWLGLMIPLAVATYYGIKKPSDFDPALRQLRTHRLLWAVQVGSASCSSDMGIYTSSSFGVNAESPGFQQARGGVWSRRLRESHEATYLGWFRRAYWPTVFTLFRSVKPNGEVTYGAWENGSKPIAHYLFYCVIIGLVAMVIVEVTRFLRVREKAGVVS